MIDRVLLYTLCFVFPNQVTTLRIRMAAPLLSLTLRVPLAAHQGVSLEPENVAP